MTAAPVDDGGARHLIPGTPLPDLDLPATRGGAINLLQLAGSSVIYIYPWTGRPGIPDPPGWDDIPGAHGSTPQTAGFRDCYDEFRWLGVEVFGLSGQSTAHQRELCERLAVPFAILSDADRSFQDTLRLPTFKAGEGTYVTRLTLIVEDGAVQHVFYPVHPPETHAAEVLTWLRAATPA
jgi:peroxiredoxin